MSGAIESTSNLLLRRHAGFVIALLIAALAIYFVGNDVFPLVDRDEPRYVQASRQMFVDGDWTTPHFLDELRLKKPVGIYWLQASAMRAIGDSPFAARLPSVLATVATLAMLASALPTVVGTRRAWWATFVFATAVLPTYLAKVGMTDAVLNAFVTGAMLCLYAIWDGRARWATWLALGVAVGAAVLVKGPPVLLYLGMTGVALFAMRWTLPRAAIAIDARPLAIRVGVVVGIASLIVLPWVICLERAHPGAVRGMLMKEVVARGTSGQEGHGAPPGYYFVTFWGTFFPWSLFAPAALIHAWRRRRIAWVRFSLAAIVGPWLFLEIYRTKLPHYFLPSFPFFAILVADVLLRSARGRIDDLRDRPFLLTVTGVAGVLVLGSLVVLLALPWLGGGSIGPSLGAGILLWIVIALAAVVAVHLLREGRTLRAAIALGASTWAILAFVFAVYFPVTPSLTLAKRVGESLRDRPGTKMMIGFKEPSVAYYEGGRIREERDGDFLQNAPRERWPQWLVMERDDFEAQPASAQARWTLVDEFRGLNPGGDGLKVLTVLLLENKAVPTTMP